MQERTSPAPVHFPDFGVYAFESHHAAAFQMETMRHDFVKMLFVVDGAGDLICERQSWQLERSTLVYIPLGFSHRIIDKPGKPLSLYAVCLTTDSLPQSVSEQIEHLPLTFARLAGNELQWHERFRRLLYEQTMQRADRSLSILGIVLWMLTGISRNSASPERRPSARERIRQCIERMEHDFYRQTSLAESAREAGLGERRFSQLFREETGDSWLNHLRRLRIHHACHLLEHTERSVTAIAFECGFSDLSNFYRAFRSETGRQPLALRNKALG